MQAIHEKTKIKVVATRRNGTTHKFTDGEWKPAIHVPKTAHERVLRNINASRLKE